MTLLLDLGVVYKDKGELVIKDQSAQICLTALNSNDDRLPKRLMQCSGTLEPHNHLQFGQVKDLFDRNMQVEVCCVLDYWAEEDRRTLDLWNYFRPYAGLRALEATNWAK